VFEKPDRSKRCGKCKSTRWNAAGVDRRRKAVAFDGPVAQDPELSIQERLDRSVTIIEQFLEENHEQILVPDIELPVDEIRKIYPMPKVPEEVFQYVEQLTMKSADLCGVIPQIFAPANARCKHGLYSCPECHH
jgi:hypothetical protein